MNGLTLLVGEGQRSWRNFYPQRRMTSLHSSSTLNRDNSYTAEHLGHEHITRNYIPANHGQINWGKRLTLSVWWLLKSEKTVFVRSLFWQNWSSVVVSQFSWRFWPGSHIYDFLKISKNCAEPSGKLLINHELTVHTPRL